MQLISSIHKPIKATIQIPGSKSMTNRVLLMAALAKGVSEIEDILLSDDTLTCINALRELGVAITLDSESHSCLVAGCQGIFPKKSANVWCQDAGTVARFLLAACAATPGEFFFDGSKQLRERPIQNLIEALRAMGATISPQSITHLPLTIKGTEFIKGGQISVDGSMSSQFLSALLMVAPFARTSLIMQTKNLVSRPFVDMTCAMMADFGVLVKRLTSDRFIVPVPQRYVARRYVVEPDLSLAANFFAAAAVTAGSITIQPINIAKSKQGDIKFLSILKKMGCQIIESVDGLMVKGSTELKGVSVDMRDCSDTFMALAAIAPFANTPTTITNIGHTRLQESNRIRVMKTELEKLNVRVEEGEDWLRVHPSKPHSGVIDSHGDHRIAMAFSIIGLRIGVTINGSQCVTKTCPEFFELWEKIHTA